MTLEEHDLLRGLMKLCEEHDALLTGATFDLPYYRLDVVRCCDREVTANKFTRGTAEVIKLERDG